MLHQAHAEELTLLACWDVHTCVAAALTHLKTLTHAVLGCCYLPQPPEVCIDE
jgi:hypothetical protein